ncbi:MAG: asparagine synthase (glutamine-hydrolyzing), partial [Bryobacteraceae bacterium]
MCGIAGIVGDRDATRSELASRAMAGALAHRGPDAEGFFSWPDAAFSHRRLAIFDLSDAGRQPMLSPDGQTGVVFNGAIYNFHELRAELEHAGYIFRTRTDTETLVHGYSHWGIDELVSRLHGMFAFALWDQRARKLFLVRDRLGVKPLIYSMRDGRLGFASTVRALRSGGFGGEIDPRAVLEFLEFGYITDQRAIFEGIHKVPAASIVEWSGGNLITREYWCPPAIPKNPISFSDAVEETERLFLRAVELRLQADVPVGALLSGGIDSGLVCWAIARLGGDITAFTVGTPGGPSDETADAQSTARELGIRHRVLAARAEDSPGLDDLVSAYGEPFACASALGMLQVSRAVKQEATVLVTGDGGDDVFLGYPEHRHFALAAQWARRLPPGSSAIWHALRPAVPHLGALRRAAHFLDYSTDGLAGVIRAHDGLPWYRQHGLIGERLVNVRLLIREKKPQRGEARRLLDDFLEYDRQGRFTAEYMTKVDGATMWRAIEARSPFLDQRLWSFASALPFDLRLRGGEPKAILRELARRR